MAAKGCEGCHWHHPEDGTVQCINLSMDNWKPKPEQRCAEYIRDEDYQPSGIWAGLAEVVSRVEAIMDVQEG